MSGTLVTGSPQEAGFYADRIELIERRAQQWIDDGVTTSLVLLAARHATIGLERAFGVAGYGSDVPLSTDAVFPIASISKPVTATAIMILVEDGELSLNRPLKEYFPELSGKGSDRILVHQLLTHTSGWVELEWPPPWGNAAEASTPCPEGQHPLLHRMLEGFFPTDTYKKPGERNDYFTMNYRLLGDLVRRVTGKLLDEFAAQRIFEPLGMSSSTYGPIGDLEPRMVTRDPNAFGPPPGWGDAPLGDASIKTTARDLAVFSQMFLNGGSYGGERILNEWTVKEMTRNQIPGIGCIGFDGHWNAEASWGLGWMIQGNAHWPYSQGILQPRGSYFHQGGTGCALWVDPVHHVVGVYLSVAYMDPLTRNPNWEFDKFQNMLAAAVEPTVGAVPPASASG